ncbi:MAG TPA: fatty acid desaturase [Rugosibacter sp.]
MYFGIIELSWWGYVVLTLVLTHISIAGVTIYLHRHQAHRALDLSPLPSHFFRFWLWLTTGMVTKEWAAIHRKHHAKCETIEDPHSPQILGIQPVLWTGVFFYVKESRNAETMAHYGHGTPDDWLERAIYTPLNKLGVFIMLGINLVLFGPWIGSLIWVIQMIWIPFWAAGVVNGIGHYWGYRNFACADASTNIFPIGLLIGGEELHNNHHTFASSAKLSNKWYEFDIGWFYIRLLEVFGLAKVKKIAPTPHFDLARPTIDLDLLQAIVTHRYDVLAKYLNSLHHLASEEITQMSIGAKEGRLMKHLLGKDESSLPVAQHARLATLLGKSERLARVYAMRKDLEALWGRSTATHDQLIKQLEDWIARAEKSGIRQMEEFSLRLRTYAV